MRTFLLVLILLGACSHLDAQYRELRAEGIALRENTRFSESINRFLGALVSPDKPRDHDLAQQIRQSQDAWLRQLEMAEAAARRARSAQERALLESRSLALAFQVKSRLTNDPDPTHTLRLAQAAYEMGGPQPNLVILQAMMEMAAVHQAGRFAYYRDLPAGPYQLDDRLVRSAGGEVLAEWVTYDPHEPALLEEAIQVDSPFDTVSLHFTAPPTGFCGSPYGFDVVNEAVLLGGKGDTLSRLRQDGGVSALAFLPDGQLITLSDFDGLAYADGAPVGDGAVRLWSTRAHPSREINDTIVRAPDTGETYYLEPGGEELLLQAETFRLRDENGQVVLTFATDTFDFGGYRLSLNPGDYFAGRVTLRDERNERVATLDGAHGLFSDDGRYILTWRYGAELWLTPYGIYSWIQKSPFHQLTDQEKRRYRLY